MMSVWPVPRLHNDQKTKCHGIHSESKFYVKHTYILEIILSDLFLFYPSKQVKGIFDLRARLDSSYDQTKKI